MSEYRKIPDYCRRMNREGLNQGTSGNLSVRDRDGFWITPSGTPYADLKVDHLVRIAHGRWDPSANPSSEWRFHHTLYAKRPDAGAVVHVHSAHATALSCLRRPIPPFHYMVAVAGVTEIPCTTYRTFGTEELADEIGRTLWKSNACLIANHGLIALGWDLEHAYSIAVEVENLARQYLLALSAGEPHLLSTEEMERILLKFRSYGKARDRQK